jgi:hypothetical protein
MSSSLPRPGRVAIHAQRSIHTGRSRDRAAAGRPFVRCHPFVSSHKRPPVGLPSVDNFDEDLRGGLVRALAELQRYFTRAAVEQWCAMIIDANEEIVSMTEGR